MLLTWQALGRLVGVIIIGALFDRVNQMLLLTVSMVIGSVSCAVIPWCTSYVSLVFPMVTSGLEIGSSGGNINPLMLVLWGDKAGCFIQLVPFSFAAGATMAPLLVKPFLLSDENQEYDLTIPNNNSAAFESYNQQTSTQIINQSIYLPSNLPNKTNQIEKKANRKAIMWIFTVISLLKILTVIGLGAHLCCSKFSISALKRTKLRTSTAKRKRKKRVTLVLLMLLMVVLFVAGGLEVTFGGLVLTFSVNHLHWSESSAALLTSLFWGFLAIGRGLGAFITRYDRSIYILFINLVLICIVSGAIIFGGYYNRYVMWVSTAIFGLALSTIFSNGILLAQQFKEVTGLLSSILIVSLYIGMVTVPAFTGYLFQQRGEVCFPYVLMGISLAALSCLIFVVILKRYHETSTERNNNIIIVTDVLAEEPPNSTTASLMGLPS